MALALSTVSFIEGFRGVLVFEGTPCVKAMSLNGCFLGHGRTSQ
jgi:hypothetical protein